MGDDQSEEDAEEGHEPKKIRRGARSGESSKRDSVSHQGVLSRRIQVQPGNVCCMDRLRHLEIILLPAVRTLKESERLKTKSKYNYVRAKSLCLAAFDIFGNCTVHFTCMTAVLGFRPSFLHAVKQLATELSGNPVREISKAMLFSLELEEHVLVPLDYQHLTTRAYLASLSNDALVQVPSTVSVAHGLSGRTSNHALKKQQATFKVWIMADRSPTGRTKDSSERFHGAV